jgi:hypothetical protein
MDPAVDDVRRSLEGRGYHYHEGFSHLSIISFVRRYFFCRNPVIAAFWSAQMASVGVAVWFTIEAESILEFSLLFLAGMASFVALIPLHEWLHGVGYRLAGAPRVEYRANWRQFVFYAIADRFVTSKRPFVVLALLPFVIINGLLLVLIATLSTAWTPGLCGALFMHVAGCSGDFALLSYYFLYWSKDPLTFDDAIKGESHFFIRL